MPCHCHPWLIDPIPTWLACSTIHQVPFQRASRAAAGGAVRQRGRGRRRPGEQGAGLPPGRVLRTRPQAVAHRK